MNRWPVILLFAFISTVRLTAEEATAETSATASEPAPFYLDPSLITKDPLKSRDDVIVGKKFTVSGFLVRPFKAFKGRKLGSGLVKVFQAFNPFSKGKDSTEEARFVGELSTQAWSSTVGWRPGASGIPDPVTHEVGLTLVSVGR
jgi:hypothetical protein